MYKIYFTAHLLDELFDSWQFQLGPGEKLIYHFWQDFPSFVFLEKELEVLVNNYFLSFRFFEPPCRIFEKIVLISLDLQVPICCPLRQSISY